MATMANLFVKDGFVGWVPREDAVNADPGVFLRADNCLVDEEGILGLRPGSSVLLSGLEGGTGSDHVHTIHTGRVGGVDKYFYAVEGNIYDGATLITAMDDLKTNDSAIGNNSSWAFFARGLTRKRYDGTTVYEWSPNRIPTAPTLTVNSPIADTISTCDSTESPDAWLTATKKEGTIAFAAGYDGTANGAISMIPSATSGRASCTLDYTARQDFDDILGYKANDDDLVDLQIYVDQPERLQWVQIIFGVGADNTRPYQKDRYEFRWDMAKPVSLKKKKKKRIEEDMIDNGHDSPPTPPEAQIQVPAYKRDLLRWNEDDDRGPRSRLPVYRDSESPNWTHLSAPRGQFTRIGSTNGQNWKTVKSVRLVAQWAKGTTTELRVDNILFIGGGDRSFTGKYRVRLQAVSKVSGKVVAVGPPSPSSDAIEAKQQSIKITIPYQIFTAFDDSITNVWIFMYGGGLDDWYRIGETGVTPSDSDMTLDEFAPTPDGVIDADDRTRFTSVGYTIPGASATPDLEFTILLSEMDAIVQNVKLQRGIVQAPENIIAIEYYKSRMVVLTEEGYIYFSERNQPGTFTTYHTRVTDDTPLWMKASPSGLYVGTRKDVYRIVNDGNFVDAYTIDFTLRPLNVPHPPVDEMIWAEGNEIIYRAADGPILLIGESISHFPIDDIEPLWRGVSRHGIEPLNTSGGRFRIAVDNKILFMLAPEGDEYESNTIYRYSFITRKWSRTTYPWNFTALARGPLGRAIAGTTGGQVIFLDDEDSPGYDDVHLIGHVVWTPLTDGGNPLIRKDPFDFQVGIGTGNTATWCYLLKEGDTGGDPSASFEIRGGDNETWRQNISAGVYTGFSDGFRLIQCRIEGNTPQFLLRHFNLAYRPRPQRMMNLDTGYIWAPSGGDRLDFKEVEIMVWADAAVNVSVYCDGTLRTGPVAVTPTVNQVKKYRIPMVRGTAGSQIRVVLDTSDAAGTDNAGFECYSIRVRPYPTGNATSKQPIPLFPLQER